MPGAFTETLANRKTRVKLLYQHQSSEPIGVVHDVAEDSIGLKFTAALVLAVGRAREAYELLKAQAIDGVSIGFSMYSPADAEYGNDGITRYKRVKLHEFSIVTFPCNEHSRVLSIKSAADNISTEREYEQFLRDAGFSARVAKTLTTAWKKTARDAGDIEEVTEAIEKLRNIITARKH